MKIYIFEACSNKTKFGLLFVFQKSHHRVDNLDNGLQQSLSHPVFSVQPGCSTHRELRVLLQDRAGDDSWHHLCRRAADPGHRRCHVSLCRLSPSEDRKC